MTVTGSGINSVARVKGYTRRVDLLERTIEGFTGSGGCADTFCAAGSAYDVIITENRHRVVLKHMKKKHFYKKKNFISTFICMTILFLNEKTSI